MASLSHKKDRGISKSGFVLNNQSVTLDFELSYNELTLDWYYIFQKRNIFLFLIFQLMYYLMINSDKFRIM